MRHVQLLAICALALSLVACPDGREQASPGASVSPAPSAAAAPVREATTDGGSFRVSYESVPAAIPLNRPFRVKLRVSSVDEGGALPRGLQIKANAGMPGHGHGMNTLTRGRAVGDGQYEFEGFLFHMPGAWEITVDVTTAEASERATFDVMLK